MLRRTTSKLLPKRVLFVLSNNSKLGATDNQTGYWLEEVAVPYEAITGAGFAVDFATPTGDEAPADPGSLEKDKRNDACERFLADADLQQRLKETLRVDKCRMRHYAGIFVPGGHGLLWDLPRHHETSALIADFADAHKPIGAVCHGPWALRGVEVYGRPLLKGATYTCFSDEEEAACGLTDVVPYSMEQAAKAVGGQYSKAKEAWAPHAVTSRTTAGGAVVTGQNPASSAVTADAFLAAIRFRSGEEREEMAEAVLHSWPLP